MGYFKFICPFCNRKTGCEENTDGKIEYSCCICLLSAALSVFFIVFLVVSDGLQSLARTGNLYNGTFLIQPFANWWHNVNGLEKGGREMDDNIAQIRKLRKDRKALKTFADDVNNYFQNAIKQ